MRAVLLSLLLAAHPAKAETEVDLALVLAVDVSRSMSSAELEIQRRGYAEALTSPQVLGAIGSGFAGRIGVTYVEWAGSGTQSIVADWTLIETAGDARAFADLILANPVLTRRRTSISGALLFARLRLAVSPFAAHRHVVDISGDGPNNQGRPVVAARDALVAQGITINGLPLMTRDGTGSQWHLDDLDAYYRACVIGGPGAFVIPVLDWADFAEAVRRKLVLEMAALPTNPVVRVQYTPAPAYDCLIGEKIWERNRRYYDEP
jgi:hypothetical protein